VAGRVTTAVVLGGRGFIGSHLVDRLRRDHVDVRAVDRELDLRDLAHARRAVTGADVVYHLAADMGGVAWFHSDRDWSSSIANARITLNVIEACVAADVGRLVYASSVCALATEQTEPWTEDGLHFGTPDARYGSEKRRGAILCAEAPIDARVALLDTVYGPGQEFDGQRAKFPPAVARKALEARETGRLEMWGDGRQERCYLYVDDAVARLVTLGELETNPGPVIVGGAVPVSCNAIARLCLALAGAADAEIVHVDGPVGVPVRHTNQAKARRVFGTPQTVDYPEGFRRLIDWIGEVR
jgi:GDP-D-mannose 3',5'-epimerase